jgi:uncharacterized secreted protein with C-terminal beta-propeller domain
VGYVVTFRQTDPLFTVDLSNPADPKVMSALHLPGFSSYLHPWGDGRLLGLGFQGDQNGLIGGLKLSVFDVSNPYAVVESQELAINYDMSYAQWDHHAILADEASGLVAFAVATGHEVPGQYYFTTDYLVYRDNGAFELAATLPLAQDSYVTRGMLIDDVLYVYDGTDVQAFDTQTFDALARVSLK